MGILRTDVISHSQLESTGGSIVLDGVGDYLTFAASGAFSPATSDVTFELWFYLTDDSDFSSGSGNYYLFDMGSNGYRIQMYEGLIRFGIDGSTWTPPASGVSKSVWHHAAGVRQGNSLDLYLDGNHVGQKSTTASVTSTSLTIGNYGGAPYDGEPYGYISNFRFVKGVVYDKPFTPPKFELKNIAGTIVLGCQSSSSATDFAVTPSAITAQGNAAASSFHPDLKKDITDTGVVFTDNTKFDTLSYMVPPGGTTTERGRSRGVFGGGESPTADNVMDYLNIQSGGRAVDFGDTSITTPTSPAVSSSTRGVFKLWKTPANLNTLEYITIATTSNSTDFGDLINGIEQQGTASNATRGLFAGGLYPGSQAHNPVEYITIATTGNGTDFGDLSGTVTGLDGTADTTRAVFAGGIGPGSPWPALNTIEYFTIATTGNATDFGDLNYSARNTGSTGDSTRGVWMGGTTPSLTNIIGYVTIQTTGNATDFGDLITASADIGATSNSIRGIMGAGVTPSRVNTIEQIIIQSIGNASDFGDLTRAVSQLGACSDSHGGIS